MLDPFRSDGVVMPTTGSEPCYVPDRWNDAVLRATHNCYSYALNQLLNGARMNKPQPGEHAGKIITRKDEITCRAISQFILDDNPMDVRGPIDSVTALSLPCSRNEYRIALAVSEGEDYHFMRQDHDGMWSHKPGATEVSRVDASGRAIAVPHEADWNWSKKGGINYAHFCGYFCVTSSPSTRIGSHVNQAIAPQVEGLYPS